MDAAQLTELLAIGTIVVVGLRTGLRTLDRAEAGFSSLFVPPDRTLPWPRGVQESDSPWGWQPAVPVLSGEADGLRETPSVDLVALLAAAPAGHSHYVLTPHPVEPIRFRTLPQ